MKLIIEQNDKVFNLLDNRKGVVKSVYRELDLAIVEFENSIEKVTLDNLVVIDYQNSGENEDEDFLDILIGKFKNLIHRFKRRGA
jgi:hypothetical protein